MVVVVVVVALALALALAAAEAVAVVSSLLRYRCSPCWRRVTARVAERWVWPTNTSNRTGHSVALTELGDASERRHRAIDGLAQQHEQPQRSPLLLPRIAVDEVEGCVPD